MYNCLKVNVPVEQDGGEIKDMADITHIMIFYDSMVIRWKWWFLQNYTWNKLMIFVRWQDYSIFALLTEALVTLNTYCMPCDKTNTDYKNSFQMLKVVIEWNLSPQRNSIRFNKTCLGNVCCLAWSHILQEEWMHKKIRFYFLSRFLALCCRENLECITHFESA